MSTPKHGTTLEEARAYEARMEAFIPFEERPAFHLPARVGWMNDPNGFSYYNGQYHLFYQYYPYLVQWGPMHWGHAVSDDLLHWSNLPAALAPSERYDSRAGCFSGSAITLADGRHLLMYTGVADGPLGEDGMPTEVQTQCLAFGDGLDYEKFAGNPVIDVDQLPEGAHAEHFRDPKIWQDEAGTYHAVVANLGANDLGQVLHFASDDLTFWRSLGALAKNDGRFGVMWECPDFFELDGFDVLLVSPQDMLPEGHSFYAGNGTLALVGHVNAATGELEPETARIIDHGIDFYATQTTLAPDGRRIMVAWMQNWDTIASIRPDDRWFGQVTLPRELSVRDGKLYQQPVRELEALRRERVAYEGIRFEGEIGLAGVEGRTADVTVRVRPGGECREFAIWLAQNERFHTSLRYRPASGVLKVNRARSGSRRAILHERKCDVGLREGELTLRIVLDRNCVEIFVNGGEQTLSMIIPTEASAKAITFFADGQAEIDVEKYDLDVSGASAR